MSPSNSSYGPGSKPTVWDGDWVIATLFGGTSTPNSSKPTVWDGDETPRGYILSLFHCSKPTVWDSN
jgi:hypothetical protein